MATVGKAPSKGALKNILKVSISNVLKMLAGILVGFLLPKIIGVTDYGFYKTFTLYAGYVGILHFGLSDGIYLKYGNKNFDELDRDSFSFYTSFFILLELFVSAIACVIALFALQGDLKFIFICLAAYIFFNNLTCYYQMISQITVRFKELSFRNLIQSLITSASILILWVCFRYCNIEVNYRIYTIIHVLIIAILSIWYVFTYRKISKPNLAFTKHRCQELLEFIKIGFPLMVANLSSMLILSIDRQFVNILFPTDAYAVYAFAYNMLALITTALSAISTVLYPLMKRMDEDSLKHNYSLFVETILVIVFICLLVYFPLCWFVRWFLPKYSDSLIIFRIILPGLAISSAITIIMHNYYKTFGKNFQFFIKSLIVLVLSGIANYLAYYFFQTTISISIVSIIVMVIWYILVEEYFVRNFQAKWFKNLVYLLLMAGGFYLITMINTWWLSMIVYFVLLISITYLFYFKDINLFIKKNFLWK